MRNFSIKTLDVKRHRINFWISLSIFLYVSILLFPRLGVKLRYDDVLLSLLVPVLFVYLIRRPILSSIDRHYLLYFFYSFLGAFAFYLNTNYLNALVLPLKELTYIAIFILIKIAMRQDSYSFVYYFSRVTVIVSLISLGYVLIQLLDGTPKYYGLGHISEPNNSSYSAIIFYSLAIINFVLFKNSGDKIHIYISVLMMAAVFLTGSRTGSLLVLVFIFFYFSIVSKTLVVAIFYNFLFAFFVVYVFYGDVLYDTLFNNDIENGIISGAVRRFGTLFDIINSLERSRFPWWRDLFERFLNNPFVGCGKGCSHSVIDGRLSLGLGGDMGYLKSLVELGVFGFFLYYAIFIRLLIKANKFTGINRPILMAYIGSYLIAEFSFEIFQTSKGGALFWIILAYAFSLEMVNNKSGLNCSYSNDGRGA